MKIKAEKMIIMITTATKVKVDFMYVNKLHAFRITILIISMFARMLITDWGNTLYWHLMYLPKTCVIKSSLRFSKTTKCMFQLFIISSWKIWPVLSTKFIRSNKKLFNLPDSVLFLLAMRFLFSSKNRSFPIQKLKQVFI